MAGVSDIRNERERRNFPMSEDEWLQRQSDECVNDLRAIERRISEMASDVAGDVRKHGRDEISKRIERGASRHSDEFFGLMRQASGAWRQRARIEQILQSKSTPLDFEAWRAGQLHRLTNAPQRGFYSMERDDDT